MEVNRNGLRYASGGELHRDFHASILDGANYLRDSYGEDALREVLYNTGTKVYRTLHEKLVSGDCSELLAWWRYYMDREGADYELEETDDGAVLTVRDCRRSRNQGSVHYISPEFESEPISMPSFAFCPPPRKEGQLPISKLFCEISM